MMKSARGVALLCGLILLLLSAAFAAVIPEPEMEAEAKKIFPTIFTKCGDSYFSKRIFRFPSGETYIIAEHKDIAYQYGKYSASKNWEWKGTVRFQPTLQREYAHGEQLLKRHLRHGRLDAWGEWKKPPMSSYVYEIVKKNGVVSVIPPANMHMAPITCGEVPR
jgi:hypothetical protein